MWLVVISPWEWLRGLFGSWDNTRNDGEDFTK